MQMRASVENQEQLEAVLGTATELIYIDCGFFPPETWGEICESAHRAGQRIGLRLPHIFREKAAQYLEGFRDSLLRASFDAFLIRNMEELAWLSESGMLRELCKEKMPELISDYTMYAFNREAETCLGLIFREAEELASGMNTAETRKQPGETSENIPGSFTETLPLELNRRELAALCRDGLQKTREFVVYGRAPMMVSAQCIRKTMKSCDKKGCVMQLRDRKGMRLPVKNNCCFCYNTILNAQPTVLYDLEKELSELEPVFRRYEFTTESGREVKEILNGKRIFQSNEFTRGHFRRGVE